MEDSTALLSSIKSQCSGMLPLEIYARLFELGRACSGANIVEIGTYRGAATIALARGARSAGAAAKIVSADPFSPETLPLLGSLPEDLAKVRRNLAEFGVAEDVTLVAGQVEKLIAETDPRDIKLLLIDADGQIDRDLAKLYERLAPDAIIVIDDADGAVCAHRLERNWLIDQKHKLTHLLCAELCARGMLVEIDRVWQTAFFRKGTGRMDPADWQTVAIECFRELVFSEIEQHHFTRWMHFKLWVVRRFPGLVRRYRRVVRGQP